MTHPNTNIIPLHLWPNKWCHCQQQRATSFKSTCIFEEHKMGSSNPRSDKNYPYTWTSLQTLNHQFHTQRCDMHFHVSSIVSHTWTCDRHHCFCRIFEAITAGNVQLRHNGKCFVGSTADLIFFLVTNRAATNTCPTLMWNTQLLTTAIVVHARMICSYKNVNNKMN